MLKPGIELLFYSWLFSFLLGKGNEPSANQADISSIRRKNGNPNWDHRFLVEEGGFEPPKLTQQIYSLPPLATRELLHMKLRVELVDGFEPPTC